MDRINGADFVDLGGGKRGFRDEDLPTGTPGTVVTADFLNAAQEELIGIIEASGLVPNAADRGQLAKAIQTGRLNYVAAAGTANAITGTLTPAPAAYTIGMRITLKIANPNTGPATLNLNGLGVKSIVASDGSALVANDLSGLVSLVYNGTAFVLDTLIAATETNRGVVQLASLGEVFAGTDLMKPAAIGRVASMVQSGYWRWGSASGTANALKITLPLAPASYTFGLLVSTLVQTPNTGPATVNVNGLGVVPVQYADGSDLAPNDLFGSISLLFDGSRFVLIRTVPATTANRGIMRLATQAEMAAGTPGTGAAATPGTTAQTVQSGTWNFATAGGTANALTASLTPAPAALSTGMLVCLFLNVANTGASTLDLNGLGAKGIFYSDSTSVGAGDLFGKVLLMYDGGAWILLNNRVATQGIRGNARFATAAEMNAGARADLAGSPATIAQAIQSGQWLISGTTGTANAYVAALTPAIASYVTGMVINIWFHTPNTGPSTININGLGNRSIAPQNDPTLVANDLYGWTSLVYDGTKFIVVNTMVASETARGVVQLADAATTIAGTDQTKPAAVARMATAAQSGKWNYAVAGGTANAITATLNPAPTSWAAIVGMPHRLVMPSSPTGPATYSPNGLPPVSIVKRGGGAIADKEWLPGDIVELMYDGTVVRMIAAQRVGLDAAGFQTYSANVTLTILDLGKYTNLNQNCATVVLPKASSCPSGSVIALHNTRAGLPTTVQAAAGDDITLGELGAGSGLISFSMANQESVLLVAYSAGNNWAAVTGSTQTRFTPGFKSSLGGGPGTTGFKRTPDPSSPTGYIIDQWGFSIAGAANATQLVTLPAAFPTTLLHCAGSSGNAGIAAGASNNGGSVSNITVWAGASGAGVYWRAWGY